MGQEDRGNWAPNGAPLYDNIRRDEHWRHFDNSVDAVSFGFVATAILISMFLVMAIFERFLRPISPEFSPAGGRSHRDIESQMSYNPKLAQPSPKINMARATEVSVLMPGEDIPTFIAQPAPLPVPVPLPCPPEGIQPWPPHHHVALPSCTLHSISNAI